MRTNVNLFNTKNKLVPFFRDFGNLNLEFIVLFLILWEKRNQKNCGDLDLTNNFSSPVLTSKQKSFLAIILRWRGSDETLP